MNALTDEMNRSGEADPQYLGDGVYASFDGYHLWLRTTDGVTVTNRIALEPSVFDALLSYHQALIAKLKEREAALKLARKEKGTP